MAACPVAALGHPPRERTTPMAGGRAPGRGRGRDKHGGRRERGREKGAGQRREGTRQEGETEGRVGTGHEDSTTAKSGGPTMLTTATEVGERATLRQEDAATPVTPAPEGRRLATDSASGARLLSAGTAGVRGPGALLPRPEAGRQPKTRTPRRRGAGAARRLAAQHASTQTPRPRGTGTASDLTAAPTNAPETDAGLGTPPLLPERRAAQRVRGGG